MISDLHAARIYTENVLQSTTDVREGMERLVGYCESHVSSPVWDIIRSLDVDQDVLELGQWLIEVLSAEPPGKTVKALWFGLVNLLQDDTTRYTLYISGTEEFDTDDPTGDWACDPIYFPDNRYAPSRVLDGISGLLEQTDEDTQAIGEYVLCLGYATLAVRYALQSLTNTITPYGHKETDQSLLGCAVGFDDGDFLVIPCYIPSDYLQISGHNSSLYRGNEIQGQQYRRENCEKIFYAIKQRDYQRVEELLTCGVDINATSKEQVTALHIASCSGDILLVKLLLRHGADINAADKYGNLPLHMAVSYRQRDLVYCLLEAGSDPNAIGRGGSWTPLFNAVQNNDIDIAGILLLAGANPNIASAGAGGYYPLHDAAYRGQPEMIRLLLQYGAHIDVKNTRGETPLYIAAWQVKREVVLSLLAAGANVNIKSKRGDTPLFPGLYETDAERVRDLPVIIEALLSHGANPNVKDKQGESPLILALSMEKIEIAHILRRYGATD